MERRSLASSCIAEVAYEPASATLTVRFHEGRTSQYFAVPESVYTTLIGADSIGTCFNREVRLASYAYHRLT